MPTTAELQERAEAGLDVEIGHVFLMDGIVVGFADNAGLVGIDTGSDHSVIEGLSREGLSFRMSVDLRSSQMLDSPLSCTIREFDHDLLAAVHTDLAALWRTLHDSERELGDVPLGAGVNIYAGDDTTARTELYDQNVALERFGPGGERHRYAVPIGYELGYEHRIAQPGLDLAGAPVCPSPIVWTGRRCVLYRLYRDHLTYPDDPTMGWPSFDEAVRIWWGTMRDAGEVEGPEWRIECDGPESWLRKPLGVGYQREPVYAAGDFLLSDDPEADETGIALSLQVPGGGIGFTDYGREDFTVNITGTTPEAIRADVIAAIATLAGTTGGGDGNYNDLPGSHVAMDDQGAIHISIYSSASGPGILTLSLHRKVWELLGYDVELQTALGTSYDDPRAVRFYPTPINGSFNDAPGPDYWIAEFATGAPVSPAPATTDDPNGYTNHGATRNYSPWYLSGTQVLFADPTQGGTVAGQVVRLADAALGVNASQSTVVHPGQYDRPVAADPNDTFSTASIPGVGQCFRQGLWLFFGKRRMKGSEEEFDEYQVARASWCATGAQQDGAVFGDTILVTEWLPPGLFGFNRPRLGSDEATAGDWVARLDTINPDEGMVRAVPILALGYQKSTVDRADVVIQRLLVGSGTGAGWSDPEGNAGAVADAGDNEMSGSPVPPRDVEVATLGLGIPQNMVAPLAAWDEEADKIEVPAILNCKVGFSSGYNAEQVLRALMQVVGWCWHLRGGLYGVWCPADALTLADATEVLDPSVKAASFSSRNRRTLKQELRRWQPIDKWVVDCAWQPHLNKAGAKLELQSPDPGFRVRPGEVTETVPAHFYKPGFSSGLQQRVAHVSRFWQARHFEVKSYPVPLLGVGERLWPGTVVRLTDPELVDPAGSYGVVNRLAIVTSCSTTMGVDEGSKTVDLLVRADRSVTPRLHAPSARAWGYNSATRLMNVFDNWLAIEVDGWSDAAAFVEPEYSGIDPFGGDMVVEGWGWDGDTLAQDWSGTVDTVVTTPGAATLHFSGALTGTYYRDKDYIVVARRTTTANAAFVDTLYAPICDDAGQWTDVATPTAGYPWEA